jgi:hypothetical protein
MGEARIRSLIDEIETLKRDPRNFDKIVALLKQETREDGLLSPSDPQDTLSIWNNVGLHYQYTGFFSLMARLYEEMNNAILAEQERHTPKKRYHKGMPLYNLGIALWLQEKWEQAVKSFVLAYIEDELSHPPETATRSLAYQTLNNLGLSGLDQLQMVVREWKTQEIPRTPEQVYSKWLNGRSLMALMTFPSVQKADPEHLPGTKETRVFVGGNYSNIGLLREVRNKIQRRGYHPILAADFDIPPGRVLEYCVRLAGECKFAVFEISFENTSASVELWSRMSLFGHKTLLIYQAVIDPLVLRKQNEVEEWPRRPEGYKVILENLANISGGSVIIHAYTDLAQLDKKLDAFLPAITS